MSINNDEALAKLIINLIFNFTFSIPVEHISNDELISHLHSYGLQFSKEFLNENVNKLLVLDENLEVQNFVFNETDEIKTKIEKLLKLQENCSYLASLEDNLGKASFRYILNRYFEIIVSLTFLCNELIAINEQNSSTEKNNTSIAFKKQILLLNSHLKELENLFLKDGKKIDSTAILVQNIKRFYEFPPIQQPKIKSSILDENNFIQEIEFVGTVEVNEQLRVEDSKLDAAQNLQNKIVAEKKADKLFHQFIIHDKNLEIEKLVKNHFSNLYGKQLRFLIEYFKSKNLLIIGNISEFHRSIKTLFDDKDISHKNSIFGSKVFSINDPLYYKSVEIFDNIFKEVLSSIEKNES
jgi:hypothetical protein